MIGELTDLQERLALLLKVAVRAVDRDESLDKDEKKLMVESAKAA